MSMKKLLEASMSVLNWVAELINWKLNPGRIKIFYLKLDHVLGVSLRDREHNNLFTEVWAYAILNHL